MDLAKNSQALPTGNDIDIAVPTPNELLFDYVRRNLSASEYEIYLISIVGYLSSENPYPIPFDTAVEWLGKQKSHLKRTLLQKLKKDEHYQVLSREVEKPLSAGGLSRTSG